MKFFSIQSKNAQGSRFHRIRNRFTTKMILSFTCIEVLSLIVIALFFYSINANNMKIKILDAIDLTNRQIISQIEARYTQMDRVADTIQDYMYSLPDSQLAEGTEELDAFYTLRTNCNTLKSAFSFNHISIFLNEDSIFSKEGLMFFTLDQLERFSIDVTLLKNGNTESAWLYAPSVTYPFMLDRKKEPCSEIFCIRRLYNASTEETTFIFYVSIDTQEFSDLLSSAYEDTMIHGMLVNTDGTVISTSDTDFAAANSQLDSNLLEHLKETKSYENTSGIYYTKQLSNGWYYVNQVSPRYILANTMPYIYTMILVLILMLLATTLIVIRLAKSMTQRITLLSDSASSVSFDEEGFHGSSISYIQTIREEDYDEVDRLASAYNMMMDMIRDNIDHITQLRAQEASLKYRLLQSLINPHFLYNILDSIATCNRIGQPELANKMIMNLTKFYRLTLRKSNELITIQDELEIATLYMEMESICRGGNFTWEISMEEGIEHFMICKFTLQPFIENCILHGMQGRNQHLHIQIDICYGDDTIQIFITDNGHGISPEKLAELQHSLEIREIDTSRHFGICNVNARISSELFGHGFIEIDSTLGEGTSIKIEFAQILPD